MQDKPEENRKVNEKRELSEITGLPFSELATSWLTALIDSADDAIVSKTLDGIITSWNNGARRIFGYTEDETVGQSILMLIPPDLHQEEFDILSRIRAGQRIEHYETVRLHKDGHPIDISLTISPIKKPDGEIIGASKIARDISDRKLAEARLMEQSEIVETINRLGQILSGELDQEKLIQAVTDAATALTGAEFGAFFYNVSSDAGDDYMLYTLSGASRDDFANFPMPRATGLFGSTFRGEEIVRIDDVKADPRYGKNPPYNGMPEGHLPVTSYLAVPVISRSGEVIGGLFFGHSKPAVFTQRHERIVGGIAGQAAIAIDNARLFERIQQSLKERETLLSREQHARMEAESASRAKDEFLGMLSHELRTPLNAILGWTRILTSTKVEPETMTGALETIDRNARLQSRLIDDMLDVSRIMSGKLRLDAQPVDLTTVINAAVDTNRPAAEAKGIRLYIVLSFGSGMVLGDPVRLQQIVWNLLSNAIKFTPKDGSVRVTLERVDSSFEIRVNDTGTGIDEDIMPYIFERFRQGDSSTTKKHGGLGLGLAIVRQLVDLHGGTVKAANLDEGGAEFTVRLPVMPTRQPKVSLGDVKSIDAIFSTKVPLEYTARLDGIRILAVDDDPDSRNLIAAILERCGADVKTCKTVAEAIASVDQFKPDILVSDIGMPEEDGYSLIKTLRAGDGAGKRLPAVALTAYARVEDRMKALSAGFNMHVPKPVEPAELITVIASILNRN